MSVDAMLADLLRAEGGYTNNPSDPGGETNFGITIKVARANGYAGPMKDLTKEKALDIYRSIYWIKPGFAKVFNRSPGIAAELFDTGVNMGTGIPGTWLQACLNAFNRQGRDYPDLLEDGEIGPATLDALSAFLDQRGDEGEHVMLKALNALQGTRYLSLAKHNPKLEDFTFGWFANRVDMSV